MIAGNVEGVEDQLDRLNYALHEMLHSVRCETPSQRSVSRMSLVPNELLNDDSFSNDLNFEETGQLHERIEFLLQQNDQLSMKIEDYLSSIVESQAKKYLSITDIDQIIETLNSVKSGKSLNLCILNHTFTLTNQKENALVEFVGKQTDEERISKLEKELESLKKTESSSNLSSSIDNEDTCPTCNIDPVKLRKEIKLELNAEFLKIKNEAIERERNNLETQFEELDELKSNYLKKTKELQAQSKHFNQRKVELEKKELEFARRKSEFEKKKHDWEHKVVNFQKDPTTSEEGYSPTKFSQTELESQLKDLKSKFTSEPDSKLTMRINQIETQLTKLRTEKLLTECSKKNSKLVTNLVKAFDKEVSQDENRRKRLLDRTQLSLTGAKNPVKGQEIKTSVDKRMEILMQKEKELNEKEKFLQETWKKVPNAEELINVIQETYSHLNQNKTENQKQLLMIEQERNNLNKVFEKFLECVESFEKNKNYSLDALVKIKEYLNG